MISFCILVFLDPIFLSSQIYSPFVLQPYTLALIRAVPSPKLDQLQTVYFYQANLLNKVMYR